MRFDFSTQGQRSHSLLQWGSNIWWRFGEIHFFPIPLHELLFILWWRCSLEVAGCSLEEEPTAHPVFPLCSGSFAWNQHYARFCCCENAKLSCNFLRFRWNFDQLLTQNNNSYNTHNSHHLEILGLLESFNEWDITLELNLQRLALSGLVLPATRRQEEGSKELLLPRSSCLENNETESGKVFHLLSVLALLALLPSKNPFNCAPM